MKKMKHQWQITPRGRKTKYYECKQCGKCVVALNKKEADEHGGQCESFFQKWSKAIEVIGNI